MMVTLVKCPFFSKLSFFISWKKHPETYVLSSFPVCNAVLLIIVLLLYIRHLDSHPTLMTIAFTLTILLMSLSLVTTILLRFYVKQV